MSREVHVRFSPAIRTGGQDASARTGGEIDERSRPATPWHVYYWRDRNLRFHRYDQLDPSPRVQDLLNELDRDPTAIFWG
jgi:hypothetical protein